MAGSALPTLPTLHSPFGVNHGLRRPEGVIAIPTIGGPRLTQEEPPKYTKDDWEQLRENLIELIWDDEHGDLPMKTFKIGSSDSAKDTLSVTIKARTRLGAILGFADRDFDQRTDDYRFWHSFAEERDEDDINKYAEELIGRMFMPHGDDEWLVEIDEEVVITPFSGGLTKSAGKR